MKPYLKPLGLAQTLVLAAGLSAGAASTLPLGAVSLGGSVGTVAGAPRGASSGIVATIRVGHTPGAVAVDAPASRVFVANSDSTVTVLDARSGLPVRSVALGNHESAPGSLGDMSVLDDASAGHVFVLASPFPPARGRLFMLDARTGAVLAQAQLGVDPQRLVADGPSGLVFVTNLDSNTVSVIDARSGALRHTVAVGDGPAGITLDGPSRHVFVANSGGTVSMLDAASGVVLRSIVTGQPEAGYALILTVPGERIWFLNQLGRLVIIDAVRGTVLRTVTVGGLNFAVAADARTGHVFVADSGPNLGGHLVRVLDARTGALVRAVTVLRGPTWIVRDSATGNVVVGSTEGVSILAAASGAVVRSLPGSLAIAGALDASTHRCFVASLSGLVTVIATR